MAIVTTLKWIARLCAIALVVLGIGFWTGHWMNLITAHMAFGLALVLCLWITALFAIPARASAGLVAGAFIWGIVVIALGVTQAGIVPGSLHWIVQAVHLLIGLGALGMNERIARFIGSRGAPATPMAAH
jgi:hypothetical protein